MSSLISAIKDIAFEYENTPVRLQALRRISRIETAGLVIEEVEAEGELTTPLWVAWELVEAGLARFLEEGITGGEWTQIHYRERVHPPGRLTSLPEGFYRRAYLTLQRMRRRGEEQLGRLRGIYRDIVESRIGGVVRMAASEARAPSGLLQPEEEFLYREVRSSISRWRGEMRRMGGE
jgi:hypothetical protein